MLTGLSEEPPKKQSLSVRFVKDSTLRTITENSMGSEKSNDPITF